ncbi:alpha-xylosidase, putative [Talaromyces marneffei ATCC 18224]|uniref:alpha-glucosidase n=1 Tax=Talaromyces marneffei (strain ATCC 18224 / CBS 334.59 / QM 7333) TaxID=441960 RepID=B6QBZ1_TALMQ|nr:alpha-xylosidase, putative [Talaromyces marneffei ATCC 18224]
MHRYSFSRAPVAHPEATVGGVGKLYRFTVLTDGLLRYEWADDGCFEDRASVLAVNRRLPIPEFRVLESDTTLQIITARFHLTYDKGTFSPSGLSAAIKGFYGPHSSTWRYGNPHHTLGGTARTLDEIDGRIELEPGIVARQGFTTLDDSKSMLFDENGWLAVRQPGNNRVDGYLFAYGHDYRGAVRAFYALSGPQPLLPRWALGNWWSRYYAYNADEYLELMDRFQEKGIPLSVAVLDIDWHIVNEECVAKSGVTGWTGYTWNKKLFPDPPQFLSELHRRGLKTSLNDHPADGVQSYEELYEKMATTLGHDSFLGDPIPFDITNRAFTDAYFDILHRHFDDQGIDLWWVDWQQGPHSRIAGIDPLWVLNHFHFLDSAREGKRPLTFSRYAGPGSHRYPVGFSGDTVITWDSLKFQPEFTATASNIGFGWWSHDIGGHMHGVRDEELLVRWVQYGVFSPILRLHSSNNQWNLKEPWMLDVSCERIMTDFLRLRHRLIPYLYAMNFRAAQEGLPLVQPMYWEYPEREEAYQFPNQFLFGSELLVAPITAPQDTKARRSQVRAWFPPGRYVDIFTGAVYDGDRELWLNRSLASYPVFARKGAIIPLDGALEPANGGNDPREVEVLIIVGADGDFELVADDDQGDQVDQVTFRRTQISFRQETGEIRIGPTLTASRQWSVRLLGCSSLPEQVHVLVNAAERVCQISKVDNGSLINLGSLRPEDTIVVRLGSRPQLDVHSPTEPIIKFLRDAQIELDLKEEIWMIVSKKAPVTVRVGQLQALDLDRAVLYPILECLLADSRSAAQ